MNVEPLRRAINKIISDPSCWNQMEWHCGTQHCIGGHIQIDAGRAENADKVQEDMQQVLQCEKATVRWLTAGHRSFTELYNFARQEVSEAVYPDPPISSFRPL